MDTEWETHYIYKNESSFDIEMEYISSNGDKRVGESVQIKRGDEYQVIQTNNPGNFSPLNLLYPEGSTYYHIKWDSRNLIQVHTYG